MGRELNCIAVQVGQRVYSGLYGGRNGIVVAIHGEQRPSTIRQLGGCITMGGNASYDVAFDNGTFSPQIPESIVRGIQWEISDEVATADEIVSAVQFCKLSDAKRKETEEAHAERRAAERIDHKKNNPHLIAEGSKEAEKLRGGSLAAANIRKELKRAWPGFKFSVTSDHNAVNIKWENGPTVAQVEAIANRHEMGSFDGMDDCYHYSQERTFADVFGGVQYVFPRRDDTYEAMKLAWKNAGYNPAQIPSVEIWEGPNVDTNDRYQIRAIWSDTDFTRPNLARALEAVTPIVEKPQGPQFTSRGILANEYGSARIFRKAETAAKEADKLKAGGHLVEWYEGRCKSYFYVRLISQ